MRITSESLCFSTTYNRTIAVLTSSHLSLNGTSCKDGPAGWKAKGFAAGGPSDKEASGNKKGGGSIAKTVTTKTKWEARQRSLCMMGEDEGEIDWKYRAAKKTGGTTSLQVQQKAKIEFCAPCSQSEHANNAHKSRQTRQQLVR
jgi:hypothetical protein